MTGLRVPSPAELVPLLRVGGVLSIRTFALVGTITLAAAVATRVGTAAIGAHQVAWQLWIAAALVVDAFAVAGQALVARYMGEEKPRIAREISDRLLVLGTVVGVALAAGLAALTPVLPWALAETPAAADALLEVWWLVVLMQPLNAAIFVWDGIYIGARRFGYLAWSMVGGAALAVCLLGLVLPLGWGLLGVWSALVGINVVRAGALGAGYIGWARD